MAMVISLNTDSSCEKSHSNDFCFYCDVLSSARKVQLFGVPYRHYEYVSGIRFSACTTKFSLKEFHTSFSA